MYGIFAYICLVFMVNVGKYTIHGSFGYDIHSGKLTYQLRTDHLKMYFHLTGFYIAKLVEEMALVFFHARCNKNTASHQ